MSGLTVGSLFSGIGGIDLGLERAGMRVVWHSEIDPYASRVLAKHWPAVPNHGDITRIDFRAVERVDVLAGGFMCTDLSGAGLQEGIDGDTRSGITWREMVRAIRELRPRYVLVENVANLLAGDGGRWFGTVLGKLADLGYDAEWEVLPACAVGAPHTRERVFVVAYSNARDGQARLGNLSHWTPTVFPQHGGQGARVHRRAWMEAVSRHAGSADGVSAAVDRSAALGNAVVPQVAELIGGWIIEHARATGYLERAA